MRLVVGLGNPGSRYEKTRHNLGFGVIDTLAARWRIDVSRQKFHAWLGDGEVAGQRVVLLKPATFMNLSGLAVRAATAFYKLSPQELIVVLDDLDLPVGKVRVRAAGSSGGHRGLENIIALLGTDAFCRVRIGIGGDAKREAVEHVLSEFAPAERERVDAAVSRAADAVECWLAEGVAAAMNKFNRSDRPNGAGREPSDEGV